MSKKELVGSNWKVTQVGTGSLCVYRWPGMGGLEGREGQDIMQQAIQYSDGSWGYRRCYGFADTIPDFVPYEIEGGVTLKEALLAFKNWKRE